MAPEGTAPSIQSPPLGFKPRVTGPDVVDAFTDHLLRVVAHLVGLKERTNRTVGSGSSNPSPTAFLKRQTRRSITSRTICTLESPRPNLRNLPAFPSPKPMRRSADTSALYLISAIRPSNTRTSRIRCRNSSMLEYRSSNCRKPRRCTCRKSIKRWSTHSSAMPTPSISTQTKEKKDGRYHMYLNLEDAFAAWKKSRVRASGGRTFTCRYSLTILAHSARRASRLKTL